MSASRAIIVVENTQKKRRGRPIAVPAGGITYLCSYKTDTKTNERRYRSGDDANVCIYIYIPSAQTALQRVRSHGQSSAVHRGESGHKT